jgi:pentatricopeptide repeat protein
MEELGFKPNYVTQECLITLYAYCDCVSKAQQIYDELVSTQSTVPLSSLNAMLDAYCMNRLPMEADRLLDSAIEKGIVPNASTYKLLYKAYTRANHKMLVQKLLQRMNKQGIVPNKKFFLDALEAFGNSANRPRRVQAPNPAREPSRGSASNFVVASSSKQNLNALEAVSAAEKKARILPNSNSAMKPGYYPTAIKPDTGAESNLETATSSKPEFSFSQVVS